MELPELIFRLIKSNKEGDFWDFKAQHHAKAGDLIKDIMCLANTVRHKGERFIIFGVNDNTEIVGVPDEGRRTQADIIDILGRAGFAGNLYPDVYLTEVEIEDKTLDILIIKDMPEKPYYLQKEYDNRGVKLHAGTVYSRVRDANTQSDHVASAQDIEQMWKERFGLELQPFERLQIYLQDFDEWEEIEENSWYYKPFPEFTVQRHSEVEEIEACESWVRMATNPRAFMFDMVCKYHQTILMKECCIYFDEMRQLIPNPTIGVIEGMPAPNYYYYFVLDSPKSNLLSFLLRESKIRLGHNPEPFKSRGGNVPVIAFRGEEEFNAFESYAANNKEIFDATPYSGLIDTLRIGRYPTENDIEVLRFCSRLRNMYIQWRGVS